MGRNTKSRLSSAFSGVAFASSVALNERFSEAVEGDGASTRFSWKLSSTVVVCVADMTPFESFLAGRDIFSALKWRTKTLV